MQVSRDTLFSIWDWQAELHGLMSDNLQVICSEITKFRLTFQFHAMKSKSTGPVFPILHPCRHHLSNHTFLTHTHTHTHTHTLPQLFPRSMTITEILFCLPLFTSPYGILSVFCTNSTVLPSDRGNPHTTLRASLSMLLVSIFATNNCLWLPDPHTPHHYWCTWCLSPVTHPHLLSSIPNLSQPPYIIGNWLSWTPNFTTWTPMLKGNMKLFRQVKGYNKILPSLYLSNENTTWLQC
jgi:hypothetical protein